MTTIDTDLAELRERLRQAALKDLRRVRRRKRVAQLALVPVIVLSGGAGALAVAPMLGDPAPPEVQREFSEDRSSVPRHGRRTGPGPGTQLRAVARAGDSTLYAATTASGWCLVIGRQNRPGRATDGYACGSNNTPKPGEVAIVHAGGASDRAHNLASGYVREAAETVTVALVTGETVDAEIGREGFFVVQLPDSVLFDALPAPHGPPVVGAVARDADGNAVARWEMPRRARPPREARKPPRVRRPVRGPATGSAPAPRPAPGGTAR